MMHNYSDCSCLNLNDDVYEDDGHEDVDDNDEHEKMHLRYLLLLPMSMSLFQDDCLLYTAISLLIRTVAETLNDKKRLDKDSEHENEDADEVIVHRVTMLVVLLYRLILMMMIIMKEY